MLPVITKMSPGRRKSPFAVIFSLVKAPLVISNPGLTASPNPTRRLAFAPNISIFAEASPQMENTLLLPVVV